MGGWINNERMIACCNHGTRPVIFKIERLDYLVIKTEGLAKTMKKGAAGAYGPSACGAGTGAARQRLDRGFCQKRGGPSDEAIRAAVEKSRAAARPPLISPQFF
jgi:hypothetical protein